MSFRISGWGEQFSEAFYERATTLLTAALNKGAKHSLIADRITVKELNMGEQPPELEILEIGDFAPDRFQGLFNFHYSGNASLVLQTKIRANPLSVEKRKVPSFGAKNTMLASCAPLTVPMFLRLSNLKLNGIVVLVFSKQKGITMVFRNDPLESLRVSSSFDSIPAIARFLQREIEVQLAALFREELPSIIYKMSRLWFAKADPALPFSVPKPRSTCYGASREAELPASSNPDFLDGPPDYFESTKVDAQYPMKMGPLDVHAHPNLQSLTKMALSRNSLHPKSSNNIPMCIFRSTPFDTIHRLSAQSEEPSCTPPSTLSPSPSTEYFFTQHNVSTTGTVSPRPTIFGKMKNAHPHRRREQVKKRHVIRLQSSEIMQTSPSNTISATHNSDPFVCEPHISSNNEKSAFGDSSEKNPEKVIICDSNVKDSIEKSSLNSPIPRWRADELQRKLQEESLSKKVFNPHHNSIKLLALQRLLQANRSF
ncbi:ERMES complex subunit, membrane tether and lipid transfer protein Mdm34 [Schizosaccharomyces osmophilus]|uniref:Mitochondrial distribution and morphology protein 34 n=1 Tax=Schizosaccharomyces osmophilus TaxID=2545709 RepID=A0AAE9WAS5_9SCHI|nr:ERMES complex subunit, membrane tether and lipid transfer protein Mdm34 [Schizosaccharomyces osmophilus]WBW72765.1 ERMES complex subunit, membrane tether and lipid transfer protein Mdm34 [Schizosaccharomyces osmophilus]